MDDSVPFVCVCVCVRVCVCSSRTFHRGQACLEGLPGRRLRELPSCLLGPDAWLGISLGMNILGRLWRVAACAK
jgi:hypothetical protein